MQMKTMVQVAALTASLFLGVAAASAADLTTVQTTDGMVHGTEANGVIAFTGIPFAAPPVGELRWRAPQPPAPWSAVLEAAEFGPACMQTDDIPKSEDCLTLNVWRPAEASKAPLAMMVWIYGGALAHGNTAQYPGDAIARQGVIMVSMNYRMGRLGYFAFPQLLEDEKTELFGNYGYYDQLAALKWVQANIGAFGGDPANVTIFGESAGGGSVLSHMVSPLSRGLFAKAILQSPGVPSARAGSLPLSSLDDAQKIAMDYARTLGIVVDGKLGLTRLRAMPVESLVDDASAAQAVTALSTGVPVPGFSSSMIDGKFLTDTPDALLKAGSWAKVPVLVGANSADLGVGVATTKDELFALFGDKADAARKLYDPDGTADFDELKVQVLADKTLVEPSRHLADLVAASGEPIWWYRFSYVATAAREQQKGTKHGFEIPYTLNVPAELVGNKVSEDDKAMGTLASAYWVSFAKTSDPNGENRPNWPEYKPGAETVFNFGNEGTGVMPDPIKARLDLWAEIYDQD